jgi:hypothetical protein
MQIKSISEINNSKSYPCSNALNNIQLRMLLDINFITVSHEQELCLLKFQNKNIFWRYTRICWTWTHHSHFRNNWEYFVMNTEVIWTRKFSLWFWKMSCTCEYLIFRTLIYNRHLYIYWYTLNFNKAQLKKQLWSIFCEDL